MLFNARFDTVGVFSDAVNVHLKNLRHLLEEVDRGERLSDLIHGHHGVAINAYRVVLGFGDCQCICEAYFVR